MAVEHWAKNPSAMTDDLTYLVEDEEYTVQQYQIGSLVWTGIILDSPPAYKELPYPGNIRVRAIRDSDSFQYTETGLTQSPSTSQFNVDYDSLDHVNNVQLPGFQTTGRMAFNGTELGELVKVSYWATGPNVTIEKTVKMLAGKTIPGALSTDGLISAGTGLDFTNNKGVNLADGTAASDAINFGQLDFVRDILYSIRRSFHYNWKQGLAATANAWSAIAYGNGMYVVVAASGSNTMYSYDGIAWIGSSAAASNQWSSVTYGAGLFVAVSIDGANRVMTSPDGITWTGRTAAAAREWSAVTYGNGIFVAVASNTGSTSTGVMTSADGITWASQTATISVNWTSVVYANGLFVAVSDNGLSGGVANRVMTSPDGITWTSRNASDDNNWTGVAYGEGLFVAVSDSGTGNRVMTSPDGITWTGRAVAFDLRGVAYGNLTFSGDSPEEGLFYAFGNEFGGAGDNVVLSSPDGITWTRREKIPVAAMTWTDMTYGGNRFVGVESNGKSAATHILV